MPTKSARLYRRARQYLSIWTVNIGLDNKLGLTDINKDAENFLCGLLNIILDVKLENLNLLRMNFPAIDLADGDAGICVQVTSTEGRDKIEHTLEKFYQHHLEQQYNRLIVMILGEKKAYRGNFDQKNGFRFSKETDIWDIADLLRQIEGLSLDRMELVDKYLEAQLGPLGAETAPLNLPLQTSMAKKDFLGRVNEMAAIRETLAAEQIVCLSGLGGMGKTELAVYFGRECWPGNAYFALFSGSWEKTLRSYIAPKLPNFSPEGKTEAQIIDEALAALKKCSDRDLLILDNVDEDEGSVEQLRRELSSLPMHILITTRSEVADAVVVGKLREEELHKIFERYCPAVSPEDRDELIHAVDGHTLTVELMARLLRRERRQEAAQELLKALSDRDLSGNEFVPVSAAYPGSQKQAKINEHLRRVFRVSQMTEPEKSLMRQASLLPVDGMDKELFSKAVQKALIPVPKKRRFLDLFRRKERQQTPPKARSLMLDMADRGWLLVEDHMLHIHPVIRIVCREELEPTDETCGPFLYGLWARYDPKDYNKETYRQLAEAFALAATDLEDREGKWALRAGFIWSKLGEAKLALEWEQKMVQTLEQTKPNTKELATAYNNVGSTYGALGDHEKELEYQLKSLVIREKVLPANHPSLATSYNNVGLTYGDLGDHEKALEYQLKALGILELALPANHPNLADCCANIAVTYAQLDEIDQAVTYIRRAVEIADRPGQPHPNLEDMRQLAEILEMLQMAK